MLFESKVFNILLNLIVNTSSKLHIFMQRFFQHFELLQKACIPDNITYDSYEQSTRLARISVGILNFKKVMEVCTLMYKKLNSPFYVLQNLVTYNCFKDAQKIAKELKSSFSNDPEKLVELQRIEQVAEHNSVALNLIHKVGGLDPSLKISFEFNHHPYFGTALVKRSWSFLISIGLFSLVSLFSRRFAARNVVKVMKPKPSSFGTLSEIYVFFLSSHFLIPFVIHTLLR